MAEFRIKRSDVRKQHLVCGYGLKLFDVLVADQANGTTDFILPDGWTLAMAVHLYQRYPQIYIWLWAKRLIPRDYDVARAFPRAASTRPTNFEPQLDENGNLVPYVEASPLSSALPPGVGLPVDDEDNLPPGITKHFPKPQQIRELQQTQQADRPLSIHDQIQRRIQERAQQSDPE